MAERVVAWYRGPYRDSSGVPIHSLDGRTGKPIGDTEGLADLGDYLPFLMEAGAVDLAEEQIGAVRTWLRSGRRFLSGGRRGGVPVPSREDSFDYTDLLLGLTTVAEIHEHEGALRLARDVWKRLDEDFSVGRFICNWRSGFLGIRVPLSESVSGIYIEILTDLARVTGDRSFLERAWSLAEGWTEIDLFRRLGIFPTVHPLGRVVGLVPAVRRYANRANLTKHNSALVEALVAVFKAAKNEELDGAIRHWTAGFERHFVPGSGRPYAVVAWDGSGSGSHPIERGRLTGAVVIDLLLNIYHAIAEEKCLDLSRRIADGWLALRDSESGLIPLAEGGKVSHPDALTDFAVSLCRLAAVTGMGQYADAALGIVEAQRRYHLGEWGLFNGVDVETGAVADTIVETRFSALALKADIALAAGDAAAADERIQLLLRDR